MKKSGNALLIAIGAKPKASEEGMEPDEPVDGFGEAADAVFAALEAGDKAGFRDALKSAIELCEYDAEADGD